MLSKDRSKMSAHDVKIFDAGVKQGRKEGVSLAIEELHKLYMDHGVVPERNTPEGKTILAMARELGKLSRRMK